MKIDKEEGRNLDRALGLEWLETNGRGGYPSGKVGGANTRRYHALLLTERKPSSKRFVLVNHFDEWLEVDGETILLSTNLDGSQQRGEARPGILRGFRFTSRSFRSPACLQR
jgi:glycogen debranching enzyme